MKKYFTDDILENIESKNVIKAFNQADQHPEHHIRIVMDDRSMKINLHNEEFTIVQAVLFVWSRHDMNLFNEMYFMNFIALVVCAIAAIWQGFNGNLGWCLVEIVLALINLPYSIKWIKELFEN